MKALRTAFWHSETVMFYKSECTEITKVIDQEYLFKFRKAPKFIYYVFKVKLAYGRK